MVLFLVYALHQRQRRMAVHFPSDSLVETVPISLRIHWRYVPRLLRLIVLTLFLVALAGPRSVLKESVHHTEGIDIILAIDSSGSMAAEDFTIGNQRQNRLDVVKNVVEEFIAQRKNDRIGLVTFAAFAYSVCPLTMDYAWLRTNLARVQLGLIADGTAIGSAIASSTIRLQHSQAKSKIMILLTDGINNAGKIDPVTAARAAQALGIKIYTIGAGTEGFAPFPVQDILGGKFYQPVRIDINEDVLKKIAEITDGKYFRATDTQSLRKIYKIIDSLEKTPIKEKGYLEYDELFGVVLVVALALLLAELILSNTLLMQIP